MLYIEYVNYVSVCVCEVALQGTDGTVQRIRTQREDGLQILISERRLDSQRVSR